MNRGDRNGQKDTKPKRKKGGAANDPVCGIKKWRNVIIKSCPKRRYRTGQTMVHYNYKIDILSLSSGKSFFNRDVVFSRIPQKGGPQFKNSVLPLFIYPFGE